MEAGVGRVLGPIIIETIQKEIKESARLYSGSFTFQIHPNRVGKHTHRRYVCLDLSHLTFFFFFAHQLDNNPLEIFFIIGRTRLFTVQKRRANKGGGETNLIHASGVSMGRFLSHCRMPFDIGMGLRPFQRQLIDGCVVLVTGAPHDGGEPRRERLEHVPVLTGCCPSILRARWCGRGERDRGVCG